MRGIVIGNQGNTRASSPLRGFFPMLSTYKVSIVGSYQNEGLLFESWHPIS
jgi:hypothetical protein